MDDHDLECPHGDYWSACPICKANHRKANPPADAARDAMNIRDTLYTAIRTTDLQGHLTDEDCLNLADVALEIVQRGDGVRVPLELAKQIRHSWTIFQPGFILHDQFSELVDAAIAAGADPITPPDCEDSATPATRT